MDIRPEARTIMIELARPATEPNPQIQQQVLDLINSLAALNSIEWEPMPLTALAQAHTNADTIGAEVSFHAFTAVVNYLSNTPRFPWRQNSVSRS